MKDGKTKYNGEKNCQEAAEYFLFLFHSIISLDSGNPEEKNETG